jgi:hypothetical protein
MIFHGALLVVALADMLGQAEAQVALLLQLGLEVPGVAPAGLSRG